MRLDTLVIEAFLPLHYFCFSRHHYFHHFSLLLYFLQIIITYFHIIFIIACHPFSPFSFSRMDGRSCFFSDAMPHQWQASISFLLQSHYFSLSAAIATPTACHAIIDYYYCFFMLAFFACLCLFFPSFRLPLPPGWHFLILITLLPPLLESGH